MALRIVIGDVTIGIQGQDFAYIFSVGMGGMESLYKDGKEWLYRAPRPAFWRGVFDCFSNPYLYFEISVPTRKDLPKGKKVLMSMIPESSERMLLCVDSDFDFLYQTLKENYPYWNLAERTQNIDLEEQYRICREKIKNSETDMQLFTNIQGFVGPCGGIGHLQLVVENWADDYSNLDGISEDLLPLMRKISDAYANDTSVAAYEKIEKSFQNAWKKVEDRKSVV